MSLIKSRAVLILEICLFNADLVVQQNNGNFSTMEQWETLTSPCSTFKWRRLVFCKTSSNFLSVRPWRWSGPFLSRPLHQTPDPNGNVTGLCLLWSHRKLGKNRSLLEHRSGNSQLPLPPVHFEVIKNSICRSHLDQHHPHSVIDVNFHSSTALLHPTPLTISPESHSYENLVGTLSPHFHKTKKSIPWLSTNSSPSWKMQTFPRI